MYYLILIVLAVVLVLLFLQALVKADVKKLAKHLRYGGSAILFLAAIFFGLTGRYAFAVPLAFFGFTLLRNSSALGWMGAQKSAQQNSRVRTSLIEMVLDHDTSAMAGRVLAGDFEGRELDSLSMDELAALYATARSTQDQSLDLLETYLDRMHPEWAQEKEFADQAGKSRARSPKSGPMSRDEAFEVLGLKPGVGDKEISNAHKKLMKKLHPDQGGSDYLAAKLNEAKDILLGR